jgi:Holliday junction DNA helicase RuvA
MAILGTLGADGVSRAIAIGDWTAVKAAPGVGPKIAQRVVIELKDKAPAVMAMAGAGAMAPPARPTAGGGEVIEPAAPAPQRPAASSAQADALSALSNLGYAPGEAAAAVATAAGDLPGATPEALIRAALRLLAPKG